MIAIESIVLAAEGGAPDGFTITLPSSGASVVIKVKLTEETPEKFRLELRKVGVETPIKSHPDPVGPKFTEHEFRWDDAPVGDTKFTVALLDENGDQVDVSDELHVLVAPTAGATSPEEGGNRTGNGAETTAVVEASPGVYDGEFAAYSGVVAAAVIGAIVWTAALALDNLDVPSTVSLLSDKAVLNGTFGERVAAGVIEATLALGGVLLIVGGWLGAIETRGRLFRHGEAPRVTVTTQAEGAPTGAHSSAQKGPLEVGKDAAEAIGVLFTRVATMRAVAATLAVGALLVVSAIWGAAKLIPDTPFATSSTTTTLGSPTATSTTQPATAATPVNSDASAPSTRAGDD